jgi:hypothetical protein
MIELQEYTDFRGSLLKVDREGGVIRRVKILGSESANGRTYPAATIVKAANLYEGVKVNLNHPDDSPSTPRRYEDRLGALHDVTVAGDGLYADLRFNPKHPVTEQLLWDAEHAPENVGLSHNVRAAISKKPGGKVVVEEINQVLSVDLVADPATTKGLFESHHRQEEETPMELTLESLQKEHPDLVKEIQEAVIKQQGDADKVAALEAENKTLKAKLDEHEAKERQAAEQGKVDKLIEESKLPDRLVTDTFRRTLLEAGDEERTALIEDRQAIAKEIPEQRPTSRERTPGGQHKATDYTGFLEAAKS